jgi:N-acyl-D-aspartate/D-glutamate deacylase
VSRSFGCPSAESKIRQGVTTEVVGMCSFSQAPLRADQRDIGRGWAGGGLRDRGLVQPGCFADLTVVDPATVKDESTYPEPHRYPTGVPYVIVNGTVVVDGGRMGAARPGRVLAPR